MIKRVIFLTEMRFTSRDYRRFGLKLLGENGFEVEIWDVTFILHPEFAATYVPPDLLVYGGLTVFRDKGELSTKIACLSEDDFVISLLHYDFCRLWIYRAISKSFTNYTIFNSNTIPVFCARRRFPLSLLDKIRWLAGFRRRDPWKRVYTRLPTRFLSVRPATFILAGGSRSLTYPLPREKDTEILWAHSLDYDLYLEIKDAPCTEKETAVFIDQYYPFHTDIGDYHPAVDPDKYYRAISNFFDFFEKETGLEIIIAAHPRSDYKKPSDYFKGRKCIKGQTEKLIRESKAVLNHKSTAINLVVLFRKPVIFITCADFENGSEGQCISDFARRFGKTPICVDNIKYVNWAKEFSVNDSYYQKYKAEYIKTAFSQDMPYWQIVADRLKKGF